MVDVLVNVTRLSCCGTVTSCARSVLKKEKSACREKRLSGPHPHVWCFLRRPRFEHKNNAIFTAFVPSSHSNASGPLEVGAQRSRWTVSISRKLAPTNELTCDSSMVVLFGKGHMSGSRAFMVLRCRRAFSLSISMTSHIDWSDSVISLIMRYDRRFVEVLKIGVISYIFGKRSGCFVLFHCLTWSWGGRGCATSVDCICREGRSRRLKM